MSSTAMFTAVTGTAAQQVRIDVIANNLANLGTIGYKRQRAQFEDLMYETLRVPSAEGDSPTGLQFGRGTRVVSTENMHTPGSMRQTGEVLDLAIRGRGFFAITRTNGDTAYTRNGQFHLDTNGNLVTSAGLLLDPPITIPQDAQSITIGRDGIVTVMQPGSTASTNVGQIQLTNFQNPGGLINLGENLFAETDSSGSPITGNPGEDAFGDLAQAMLEDSNVNVAEELVNLILAQRAFEANTRVISTSDEMMRFVTQR
jgi:flagellar basal-body rod protein FlgG